MNRRRLFAAAALALAAGGAARAETLAEAMALAYQTNPQLASARATQRALDETYVQARAGWGPTVGLTGQAYYQHTSYGRAASSLASTVSVQPSGTTTGATSSGAAVQSSGGPELNYGYAALTVTQPLYTGGKVAAEVQAADAAVQAGRQSLRAIEASVLSAVVTAYADVLRDAAILHIRDEAVRVLFAQSEEATAKFKVGQANRVDVSQAEAQLASAQALVASARAQLAISRAEYRAAVGQSPGDLAEPPPLPGVPASVDQAFDAAEAQSPLLGQAELTEAASRARLAAARANFRPTISAQASYGAEGALVPFAGREFDRVASGQIVLTQPLFTAGLNGSLTREARAQNEADRLSIETVRRQVIQQVASAWETLSGAQAGLQSDLKGLTAAQTAFDGIREEYRVGLSSTLDVLIQQQTLESAQLSVASARHDAYVASATLLAAIGRLQADDLISGQPAYDPARAFDRVKSRGVTPWEPLEAAVDHVLEPAADPATPHPGPPSTGPIEMRPVGG
jgi:outer membrane protein